jgi:ABC-type Mn2+/Zn2+ transport system ATPase subunit
MLTLLSGRLLHLHEERLGLLSSGSKKKMHLARSKYQAPYLLQLLYFSIDNAAVIYTKSLNSLKMNVRGINLNL